MTTRFFIPAPAAVPRLPGGLLLPILFLILSLFAGGSRAGRKEQLGRGDEDKSRLEADDQDKNGSEVQPEIIGRHSRFDNVVHREGAGNGRGEVVYKAP